VVANSLVFVQHHQWRLHTFNFNVQCPL